MTSYYSKRQIGSKYSSSYSVYITTDEGTVISPFHDIPLNSENESNIFNAVIEIPRFESAKFEINKSKKMNPITQDVKKEKLRFIKNVFPYRGMPFNYGALPQTYEDPESFDTCTKTFGDNDPLDIIEIGNIKKDVGDVCQVKVLGSLNLIDSGETDWKIICIDISDPLASSINTIDDINSFFPGLLEGIKRWIKVYKIPDGKPEQVLGYNEDILKQDATLEIIKETHRSWKRLVEKDESNSRGIFINSSAEVNFSIDKNGEKELDSQKPDDDYRYYYVKE